MLFNVDIFVIKSDGSTKKMKGTIQNKIAYIISKYTQEVPKSLYEVMEGDVLKANGLEYKVTSVLLNKSVNPNFLYYIQFKFADI